MTIDEGLQRYKKFLMNPPRDYHMSNKEKRELASIGVNPDEAETKIRIDVINRYVHHELIKHRIQLEKDKNPLRKAI